MTEVEAEPLLRVGKESRAEEVEEQTPSTEGQGKEDGADTDDGDARRSDVGADNAESLSETERGAALRTSPAAETKQQEFHLVKLARNGMVYISIPSRSPGDFVTFFDKIIKEFHTRSRAAPRYFHGISYLSSIYHISHSKQFGSFDLATPVEGNAICRYLGIMTTT